MIIFSSAAHSAEELNRQRRLKVATDERAGVISANMKQRNLSKHHTGSQITDVYP